MLLISNLRLPIHADEQTLQKKLAKLLGVRPQQLSQVTLTKQSIDARKKNDVHLVCSVRVSLPNEPEILQRSIKGVTRWSDDRYIPPTVTRTSSIQPVVVGAGPAGLFSALTLAEAGLRPIILERGSDVDQRVLDIETYWATGTLNPQSNVQFGEGGAGTFSDGKLTTGIHDPRISHVLQTFVAHGAPPDIQWSHKPHIGTDILRQVVKSIRLHLFSLGAQLRFHHQLIGLTQKDGKLTSIQVSHDGEIYTLPCDTLVLAPGHSARDTFAMLHQQGLSMEQKNFAIGVRIEHHQEMISKAQFGSCWDKLPAADYKLSCHLPNGRSAYTFCVCPGGQVVAAASNEGQVVTNGMSLRARDSENINGGFLVGVGPDDFPGQDPLAGVRFQEQWERAAWLFGGRSPMAPAQTVRDFLARQPSQHGGTITPSYRPGVVWGSLDEVLPTYVLDTLRQALHIFDRKLHGFAAPDAVLTGVETRSSSPVRILRNERFQSPSLSGVYPCGEGAGYAGGITSAAVDGIKVAEQVVQHNPR